MRNQPRRTTTPASYRMVPPMRLARAEWILRRLAAMSPAEITHRAVEQAKRQAWRNDRRGWAAFSCSDGPLESPAILAERLRAPLTPAVARQADRVATSPLDEQLANPLRIRTVSDTGEMAVVGG